MKTIVAASALAAGLLCGVFVTSPGAPTTMLAYGHAVEPTTPISGVTGAPSGDARTGTDPLVPYGTDPQVPTANIDMNHDEGLAPNGEVDLAF